MIVEVRKTEVKSLTWSEYIKRETLYLTLTSVLRKEEYSFSDECVEADYEGWHEEDREVYDSNISI